ncbi:MAG: XdhC family protein [Pseudomonadota bacterium]
MKKAEDILDLVSDYKARGMPFALATVVRTVAATAAKAGAKAVITPEGKIAGGWIGGGCARAAVIAAAREALADGKPRLVSVQPEDLLDAQGLRPGEEREGVAFAKNMCPSRGTMDVFVEPLLPRPIVLVLGASPVALAIADLARRIGFSVTAAAPPDELGLFGDLDGRIDGFDLPARAEGERFVVVATQGRRDFDALKAALSIDADYVAFVGSRGKAAALREQLREAGLAPAQIDRLRAPAGLDIGAIGPEEIALSVVAEIVETRRRGQRAAVNHGQA